MNRCVFTIAGSTAREITRQAIFYFIAGGGVALMFFSFSFTLFAFGDEARMIREMGVSTVTICCLCLTSLSATNTISGEIEKGTMMTLLSKPVDRRSVLLGKFFGILTAVSLIFAMMSLFLMISLSVKESLDYHAGLLTAFERVGSSTVIQLIFSFLQVAIMCAIATAGSLYLPMISNLICCVVVFVLGNLINYFHGMLMSEGGIPWYVMLFFTFIPNLERFSTIGLDSKFGSFSLSYLALLLIYAIVYIAFVIVLTFELFDRKECQ